MPVVSTPSDLFYTTSTGGEVIGNNGSKSEGKDVTVPKEKAGCGDCEDVEGGTKLDTVTDYLDV